MTFALLLAAGCVDQKKEVSLYRKVLDAHTPSTTQPAPSQEPLTLLQAMALANANNEQLGLQGEDYVQALINKNRVAAAFFPTVSLAPSFSLHSVPSLGGIRNAGEGWQVPVVGNINVFRGLGDVANLHAAESAIVQQRYLLLDLQQTVLLNVAQTYYQVLRSERQVMVLTNSLEVQRARVQEIEQQFNNGLATRLDVAQSRAQEQGTAASLVRAKDDVANGRSTLAKLIGVEVVDQHLVERFEVPRDVDPEFKFERRALRLREDLLAADHAVDIAKENVKAAVAEYYPSVTIDVAAFLYPESFIDAHRWNALLLTNFPIFTAGVIEADVRTAWSKLRQTLLFQSQVRRQALNDVQVGYSNLTTNFEAIRDLQGQVDAAQEAYDQSRSSFENGLAINLDVLVAQDQLLTAQLDLASAQFDSIVFYLDLLRASGEMNRVLRVFPPETQPATTQPTATAPGTMP